MKGKIRRIVVIILAIVMIAAMAACEKTGPSQPEQVKTGSEPVKTTEPAKPAPINIFFIQDNLPAENNSIIQEIGREVNVKLTVTTAPEKDYLSKLNVLIASGDLPDCFQSQSPAKLREYVANGVVAQLDELLAKYGKNILDNKGKFMQGGVEIDGKVYAIPNGLQHVPFYAVRQDWLENLNLQAPTNLDDLYNVLKAFTFNDPDKDSKNNTYGFGLSWNSTGQMLSFLFAAYDIPVDRPCYVDGKVVPYFMHPNFPEAIKYINKLYKDGLIDPDFATLTAMQSFEKLWNGVYGSFNFNPAGITNNWIPRYTENPKPTFTYTVIKGKDGKGGTYRPIMDSSSICISNKSNEKEAVVKVLDFLLSEKGQTLTYLGIEGKHFKWEEPGKTFEYLPPYTDLAVHRNDGGLVYYYILCPFNGIEIKLLNETTKKAYEMVDKNQVDDAYIYETPQIQLDTGSVLIDHVRNSVISLIVTKGNIDQELENYKKKFMDIGGDKWIQQATDIYKKEKGIK